MSCREATVVALILAQGTLHDAPRAKTPRDARHVTIKVQHASMDFLLGVS